MSIRSRDAGLFATLLRRARLAAGLSQEALAERAAISAAAVSALERGVNRQPYLTTVERLAAALGLMVGERAALLAAARLQTADPAPESAAALPTPGLPLWPTPLVGREREIAVVADFLARPAVRMLTLTGAGGVGKTRLALAVAAGQVERFADGIWLVELATLTEPSLVPGAVADALGVREVTGSPLHHTLSMYLKDRRLLLVLDNCEHLIAACAALVGTLLRICPYLRLLATSGKGCTSRANIPIGCPRCPSLTWPICPRPSAWPNRQQSRSSWRGCGSGSRNSR